MIPLTRSESMDEGSQISYESISGYLLKKSSTGVWQKRYFETNGRHLTYYKSHKMTKLLAALSLPQVGAIKLTGIQEEDGAIFYIDLRDRQLLLKASNIDEADRWVSTLIALRDGVANDSSTYMPETFTGGSKASETDKTSSTPTQTTNLMNNSNSNSNYDNSSKNKNNRTSNGSIDHNEDDPKAVLLKTPRNWFNFWYAICS